MPLDSHSLCPCGSGKEIRFCCSDMLKEYQQLETVLSGGQFAAALSMIEKLEKDHPNNAALISAKCLILRETRQRKRNMRKPFARRQSRATPHSNSPWAFCT